VAELQVAVNENGYGDNDEWIVTTSTRRLHDSITDAADEQQSTGINHLSNTMKLHASSPSEHAGLLKTILYNAEDSN